MMKTHHSHSYPLLSALLFFFFVTWSSSGSLLSIWLHQEVGLKAGDTLGIGLQYPYPTVKRQADINPAENTAE